MAQKIRILLVDDHPLVREWLTNLLNQQADFQVCGETGNAPEAMQLIGDTQPDIAIVDISLASGSGIELIKSIKSSHAQVAVMVLSMHDELLYAERALRAGAGGYIMKSEATQKVIQAIRAVLSGEIYVSPRVASLMAQKFVASKSGRSSFSIEQLSDRELEVFQLLGCGYSTRQISEHLHVGFKTVQGYSARIKEKLNLANINELMREAIRWQENQNKSNF
ncbi:MAG: response regulator transcription factor [Verrucomicrobiota bacterium]|jgi:DNA-binding NarL/FixJ family response regulator